MERDTKLNIAYALMVTIVIVVTYYTGNFYKSVISNSGANYVAFADLIGCYAYPFIALAVVGNIIYFILAPIRCKL